SVLEHLPQMSVGHLSDAGYEMGKVNINRQMKEPDLEVTSEEDCDKFDDRRNIQSLPIFEHLQLKRNARVSVNPEKHVKNTGAAEERGATSVQLRPKTEQSGRFDSDKKQWKAGKPDMTYLVFSCSYLIVSPSLSDFNPSGVLGCLWVLKKVEKTQELLKRKPLFERFQPKWSAQVFMGPEESGENTEAAEEKEPDLELASGDDQNRCYSSESNQSLVEKTKTHASSEIDIAKYPSEADVSRATASADAGIAASAMDELVLQRKSGEINNQRFLIKENAMHDGIELEYSELKVKVKEQAEKIEELRGCLQNSCEKLEQDEKLMEDEEKSIKELNELKQYLKYNLCQQKKKNDELEKEIISVQCSLPVTECFKYCCLEIIFCESHDLTPFGDLEFDGWYQSQAVTPLHAFKDMMDCISLIVNEELAHKVKQKTVFGFFSNQHDSVVKQVLAEWKKIVSINRKMFPLCGLKYKDWHQPCCFVFTIGPAPTPLGLLNRVHLNYEFYEIVNIQITGILSV
ncbi:POTE ankyrin domain family member A-like protein, partial [Cricetulus griseus]